MPRAKQNRLESGALGEVFSREPAEAAAISRRLGQTLPVTLHLPKKTVTPGALNPGSRAPGRPGKRPQNDDADNELCA